MVTRIPRTGIGLDRRRDPGSATGAPAKKRFVLADRDGTLIRECHYLSEPEEVELLPGVIEGISLLRRLGLGVVVVTNQSGVGRGFFSHEQVEKVHQRLLQLLEEGRVGLEGIYYCPHRPEEGCQCRKPETGLVERAAEEWGFEPRESWVIGDKECDIELGKRLGAPAILVTSGYGLRTKARVESIPDFVADGFAGAARIIAGQIEATVTGGQTR